MGADFLSKLKPGGQGNKNRLYYIKLNVSIKGIRHKKQSKMSGNRLGKEYLQGIYIKGLKFRIVEELLQNQQQKRKLGRKEERKGGREGGKKGEK